ncbi:hypothetical protein [Halorubrum tebenquichense]|uniref:hypothetical protein n=1 Tax=Halorubrum tebenquichense TaxID=119434 RepID=UPI00126838D1|nr:hypothetical protein [Halorubrum tebenquichense]
MKAGVIGAIDGTFDEFESFHENTEKDGNRFSRSFQIEESKPLDTGHVGYKGEAAIHEVEDTETVEIDPETGKIEVSEGGHVGGKYTEFVAVPGEFIAVSSGSGTFAFQLVQEQHPGTFVERIEIDLNAYAEKYYRAEGVNPWQVGFYGNIGEAEKGVVYGEDVFSDGEVGDVLDRSYLNQLGLEYEIQGVDMKMTMAESGYVEVYNPSNFKFDEYATYIVDEILEFAKEE